MSIEIVVSYQYVVIGTFIAFFGAYLGSTLTEHYRTSMRVDPVFLSHSATPSIISISLGGVAIWCMHIVDMGAYSYYHNGMKLDMQYDILLIIISFISAFVLINIGVGIASQDRIFSQERTDVFKMLVADAKNQSFKNIQNVNVLWTVALFKGLHFLIFGGIISGLGICIMHFLGMRAIIADLKMNWNGGIIFCAVITSCIVSSIAFWIMFRLLALRPEIESLRVINAIVTAIAVSGMHFVGMSAATFEYSLGESNRQALGPVISSEKIEFYAMVAASILYWSLTLCVNADTRMWNSKLSVIIQESGDLFLDQSRMPHLGRDSFLRAYFDVRKKVPEVDHTFILKLSQHVNLASRNSMFTSYAEEEARMKDERSVKNDDSNLAQVYEVEAPESDGDDTK
jgi:NO-binding membrane sensor protein with MHYT domain